jgi:hypothetical protein
MIVNGVRTLDKKERIVAGAAIGLIVYTLTLGLIGPMVSSALANRTISNSGSITAYGVGVYSDSACTSPISSISWGTLSPGGSATQTVYIRNEGNTAVTLTKATSAWTPSNASTYITLNWDYSSQSLTANQVLQVKFTLAVSSTISGITNFSFTITITAS